LDSITVLHAAWCRTVPFDNVRKLTHVNNRAPDPLPGDDTTDFFEAWLTYGTDGTCWAGNGALTIKPPMGRTPRCASTKLPPILSRGRLASLPSAVPTDAKR
jgi:hypothetical protein